LKLPIVLLLPKLMVPPERVTFADVANCPARLAVIVPPLETTSPASATVPAALSKPIEPALMVVTPL